MGFLDWLFGRKKSEETQERKVEGLDLGYSKSLLKKRIEEETEKFWPSIEKFHSGLKSRNERFEKALDDLGKSNPAEKIDDQVLKIALTSRDSFISKMSAISTVIKRDFSKDIESFADYHETVSSIINQANQGTVKEFMSLNVAFKKETEEIVDGMKEVKNHVEGFRDEMKRRRQKIETYQKLLNGIRILEEKVSEKSESEKKIAELKIDLEDLEKERIDSEKQLEDLNQSEIWKSYIQSTKDKEAVESEIRKIIEEVVSIFASISRVLKKFVKSVEDGSASSKNRDLLKKYIESPFDAFVQDTNMETITPALVSIGEMLNNKKLIIDNQDETLKLINNLQSSKSLNRLAEKYSEQSAKLSELKGKIDNHEYLKKKKELQDRVSAISRDSEERRKILDYQTRFKENAESEIQKMQEDLKNKLKEI